MKAPGESLGDIIYRRPEIYTAFYPDRTPAASMRAESGAYSAPSILMMLAPSNARNMEPERFDRRDGIIRPMDLGGKLGISLLFSVYEPGVRQPGFDGNDPDLIADPGAEGFFTVTDWMDEVSAALIAAQNVPGSDLFLWEGSLTYSPYMEGGYISDTRPIYYGIMNMVFGHYARGLSAADAAITAALEG